MTSYTITFGKLGDTYPVPPLTLTEDDPNAFACKVAEYAIPYLRPALEAAGCPEFADCTFESNAERTAGNFLWLDITTGGGAEFCGARIEEVPDQPPGAAS